jgi:hypothetical protein
MDRDGSLFDMRMENHGKPNLFENIPGKVRLMDTGGNYPYLP